MDNDDEQVGRLLTRREALAALGLSGAAMVAGGAAWGGARPAPTAGAGFVSGPMPQCVVRPEQTEGPFFVDRMLERTDIRSDAITGRVSEGARLDLAFTVSRVGSGGCTPLPGAQLDVWQCDARGVYSAVRDRRGDAQRESFLRGHQVTDATGRAAFTTIYPGWYQGRAVHIHFKIRTEVGAPRGYEFVSQLYFDDALTDRVHAQPAYAGRGARDRRNGDDRIFRSGGEQLLLAVHEGAGGTFEGAFEIGLQI